MEIGAIWDTSIATHTSQVSLLQCMCMLFVGFVWLARALYDEFYDTQMYGQGGVEQW